eukprot:150047_1
MCINITLLMLFILLCNSMDIIFYDSMDNAQATGWSFSGSKYQAPTNSCPGSQTKYGYPYSCFCPNGGYCSRIYGDVAFQNDYDIGTMMYKSFDISDLASVHIRYDLSSSRYGYRVQYKYNNQKNYITVHSSDNLGRYLNHNVTFASPTTATSVIVRFRMDHGWPIHYLATSSGSVKLLPNMCIGTTASPTLYPTLSPTPSPTTFPTPSPTYTPTPSPTTIPSPSPTSNPTMHPTLPPTLAPSFSPSLSPSNAPTNVPSNMPTYSTYDPSITPSYSPTMAPSIPPTNNPSFAPTTPPTNSPTYIEEVEYGKCEDLSEY